MERDFLGIGAGRSAPREEADYLDRPALQWPYLSMATPKQQFMHLQAVQEERSKTIFFDQVPSSGFHPVVADVLASGHRFPSALLQKHSGADGQGIHQFKLPSRTARGCDPFNGTSIPIVSDTSFPIGEASPFFPVGCSEIGSATGIASLKQPHPLAGGPIASSPGADTSTATVASRDLVAPPDGTAQLTIFFGGMVNVYNDVPLERVKAIMILAGGNASSLNPSATNAPVPAAVDVRSKVYATEKKGVSHTQNMSHDRTRVAPTCSALSSPVSTASHSGVMSASGSNATIVPTGSKTALSFSSASQTEPQKTVATTAVGSASSANFSSSAVPQARKASLARFLEKRKERVTNMAPYPSPQKMPEYASTVDAESVTGEALHARRLEQSWCLNTQQKQF